MTDLRTLITESLLTSSPVSSFFISSPRARSSVAGLAFLLSREVFTSLIETPGADFSFAIKCLPEVLFSSMVTVNVVTLQIYYFIIQVILAWVPEILTNYHSSKNKAPQEVLLRGLDDFRSGPDGTASFFPSPSKICSHFFLFRLKSVNLWQLYFNQIKFRQLLTKLFNKST